MEKLSKVILVLLLAIIHVDLFANGSSGTGGGGPKLDTDKRIVIDDLGGSRWTFNPDLIKNVQLNDGEIIGMGQLLVPRRDNAKVDMSDHNRLYQMGVDNIEMNSGEIILVEPQGFYIDQ